MSCEEGVYILNGGGNIFLMAESGNDKQQLGRLLECVWDMIVLLIMENELSVERNNKDICDHLLAVLLYVKYILFLFTNFIVMTFLGLKQTFKSYRNTGANICPV